MLRVVHGNRPESLFGALLAALPPIDPFTAHTIVVGGQLVERWLVREVALARGIAAGLDLVTFDRFVDRTWAGDAAARAAGLTGVSRAQLAALVASALADDAVVSALPSVAAYLAAGRSRGGVRRVQLADRIADLAWEYAVTRPDWMPALVAGRVPNELEGNTTARWQAALISAALRRAPGRAALVPTLPWARRRAELPPPSAAGPVAVFGVSFLQRAQLEALSDLAQYTDVTAYVLDPCRELWDDVAVRKASAADPLPLVMWGKPVRDTIGALVERSGGDVEDAFVEPRGETARECLLTDVLDRSARSPKPEARSPNGVTVLACPNARRELEIVADEVRRRLDADPTLRAHEIAVWLASDPERYLAQAPSAFEAIGVPCHLVDAPIDDRGRIGEAMLALLELPTSAMRRGDLLRVLTHPAVLAGHPHVHADDWVRWTERLGIAHGADGNAHAGTYLEDHHHFHWDQGIRRLALGAFMVGDKPARVADPVRGQVDVLPEDVRPELQASAATFALLVRSLCADAAWLADHEATLTGWATAFVGLVDAYLAPRDDDAARDLERVRATLAGLARLDLDGRMLGFREAAEHARRLIEHARRNRGEPLAAGVMIAALGAMRAVPFRVAFVVGLGEGAFPAADRTSPLDVRTTARSGDVSQRDRDRAAFLEVLLCAREALYLSYVAVEDRAGTPLAPSSVVLELADALAPYLGGAASAREALAQLTVRHPLHRFDGDSLVPAAARERWAAGVRDALRTELRGHGHAIPDEDGMLALLAHPQQRELREALAIVDMPEGGVRAPVERTLTLANLRTFLDSPIQAWAQAVLELDELPDDSVIDHADEPFHVERPDRALLLREVLAAWLRDPTRGVAAWYDQLIGALQLRGTYPVGVFADAERSRDLRTLELWRDHIGPVGTVTRIGFGRASSDWAELVPALDLELSGGRTVRLTGQTEVLLGTGKRTSVIPMLRDFAPKTPYHMRGALDHVVLAAAGMAHSGHEHLILDPNGAAKRVQHARWEPEDARKYLRALVSELLDHTHGYLLPFEALVKALGGEPQLKGDPTDGLGYGPIERPDGLALSRDARQIAQRRLRPLTSRMTGDHGFEGDS